MRYWCNRRRASSGSTPSRTVTSRSLVISALTVSARLLAKRTSRLVRMPASRPLPRSTTGMPEIWWCCIRSSASASVWSGWMVTGFTTMPDSNFLTLRTSTAWRRMSRFLWITPMPPAWAIAIASRPSVTVSIAEDKSGMPSSIERVNRVLVSAWLGRTADSAGSSRTSSKVSASRNFMPCLSSLRPSVNGAPSYTRATQSQATWPAGTLRAATRLTQIKDVASDRDHP